MTTETVVDIPDRRETIEAAFEAAESAPVVEERTAPAEPAAPKADAPTERTTPTEPTADEPKAKPAAEPETANDEGNKFATDRAPQSWRPAQKAKWDKLDPDIRQEVIRRERETTKVLGESAAARQLQTAFVQAVQPFQQRLTQLGAHPIQAVQLLLKADAFLASAPPVKRAAYMAQLIKDYQIDIAELDSALAGTAQADPAKARIEQLLQERLQPFQTFIQQQQAQQRAQQEQDSQQIGATIEQMALDPKFPHFDSVREDMADLIDVASKRGLYLTLEQAYSRATAMNPEVSKLVTDQQTEEARKTAAQTANVKAQRALNASSSVGGAPNSTPAGSPGGNDRRAAIAAALDSIGGR